MSCFIFQISIDFTENSICIIKVLGEYPHFDSESRYSKRNILTSVYRSISITNQHLWYKANQNDRNNYNLYTESSGKSKRISIKISLYWKRVTMQLKFL